MTEYLGDSPALVAAEGSSLSNAYAIAYMATVGFVMNFVAGGAADCFLVDRVWEAIFHRHHHSFFHLVADDSADPFL